MFTGPEFVSALLEAQISHVVWIPDSDLGKWEESLVACRDLSLVRVCREGEAWPLAAGLFLAGARPLVVMQTTGLFESGDALRNVVYDLKLPLFGIVGARNYRQVQSTDSARRFTDAILAAWNIDFVKIESRAEQQRLIGHYRACRQASRAGLVLMAE